MKPEQLAPTLNDRTVLIADIIDGFAELEVEELEAIEKYCHNYHRAYQESDKSCITTEITVSREEENGR